MFPSFCPCRRVQDSGGLAYPGSPYLWFDVELFFVVGADASDEGEADEGVFHVGRLVSGADKHGTFTESRAHLHTWCKKHGKSRLELLIGLQGLGVKGFSCPAVFFINKDKFYFVCYYNRVQVYKHI